MAHHTPWIALLAGATLFSLAACSDDGGTDATVPPADAGFRADATPSGDTGVEERDGGFPDTGPVDTGVPRDGGDEPKSIVFLHTNDEHSHLLGFAPNIDDWPTPALDESIRGGVIRRAALLSDLRAEAARDPIRSPVATVSAGDVMMGTLFHLGNLSASPDYNLQTVLGYNVMTLGNHEFDFGPGILNGAIRTGHLIPLPLSFETLRIPLVVSNIRFSMSSPDDDGLAALYASEGAAGRPIRRTHVQRFGDVNVGFVGVVGLDAALVAPFKSPVMFSLAVNPAQACTSDAQCNRSVCVPPASDPTAASGFCAIDPSGASPSVNMPAMIADIAGAVASLRARGDVDLVVAVSHAGVSERELSALGMMGLGPENAVASEEIVLARGVDQALAAQNIPGLDLIIGGHSHTPLQEPLVIPNEASGINTYIVQAGSYGEWIGKLRLTRAGAERPWEVDTDYTGLVHVDGRVDISRVPIVTQMVVDLALGQLMDGLERSALARAGDGLLFPGEQCDLRPGGGGTILPNGGLCAGLVPGAVGGNLACHAANRQLDLSGCQFQQVKGATCGNNSAEGAEMCDGTSIPTTCEELGYDGGTLGCSANCAFNFAGCTPYFRSLLEEALNFQNQGPEIRYGMNGQRGDLFFYPIGTTTFDVGETRSHQESNLLNLVADANRWASNSLAPDLALSPVRIQIIANGVVRDGLYAGSSGVLTMADLFRVLPLGISPQESTPGYSLVDFNLAAAEALGGLEVGVGQGSLADSFWLGVSGARIQYDPSRPIFDPENPGTTGRIMRVDLIDPDGEDNPWEDATASYEEVPLFDRANGGFNGQEARMIRVSTDLYTALFMTGFGICPRQDNGAPFPNCAPCTSDTQCSTVPGSACNMTTGRCSGGAPVAFSLRTTVPVGGQLGQQGVRQELKEFLSLIAYVRQLPNSTLPTHYSDRTPRRMCCVGTACPADGSRGC